MAFGMAFWLEDEGSTRRQQRKRWGVEGERMGRLPILPGFGIRGCYALPFLPESRIGGGHQVTHGLWRLPILPEFEIRGERQGWMEAPM